MKCLVVLTALFAAAVAVSKKAPLLAENSNTAIDDEYIVIFEENIEEERINQHHSLLNNMMTLQGSPDNRVLHQYHIGSFRGYSAHIDKSILDQVRDMEEVKYVEKNQVVKASCDDQFSATWGIVRTTLRDNTGSNVYSYNPETQGQGVDVYIIDTGIDTKHSDFGGRAVWGYDAVDRPSPETDGNGHGTHCAGTVMSNTWGLAKKATAIAVKVLGANGSGTTAGVIAGVDWVNSQYSFSKKPSVANMSLGGGRSTSLNNAVNAAVNSGVHFAIAAGNEAQNACNVSPASAENGVTVAASDKADQAAYFTNYGTCVDIVAPGVSITSTWLNGGTNTISGTSMAAPHVAGVMAKYLTLYPDIDPKDMKELLTECRGNKDKVGGLRSSTPNVLVFKDCQTNADEHKE